MPPLGGPDEPAALARVARRDLADHLRDRQHAPTLILHGDADELVPIQQSKQFIQRLEALKVPCRLVTRAGQGHGWPTLGQDLTLLAEWFDQYLAAK